MTFLTLDVERLICGAPHLKEAEQKRDSQGQTAMDFADYFEQPEMVAFLDSFLYSLPAFPKDCPAELKEIHILFLPAYGVRRLGFRPSNFTFVQKALAFSRMRCLLLYLNTWPCCKNLIHVVAFNKISQKLNSQSYTNTKTHRYLFASVVSFAVPICGLASKGLS